MTLTIMYQVIMIVRINYIDFIYGKIEFDLIKVIIRFQINVFVNIDLDESESESDTQEKQPTEATDDSTYIIIYSINS